MTHLEDGNYIRQTRTFEVSTILDGAGQIRRIFI